LLENGLGGSSAISGLCVLHQQWRLRPHIEFTFDRFDTSAAVLIAHCKNYP
jgi:hypothetical protein